MRYKAVPEPPADLRGLAAVHDALPRVPRPEADCCGRIADRVGLVEDRETAREWLVFLRALGLARRTRSGGYARAETINLEGVGSGVARDGADPRDGHGRAADRDTGGGGVPGESGTNAGGTSDAWPGGPDGAAGAERETERGHDPDASRQLAARFRERVLGADAAVEALGEDPRDPAAVFDDVADEVPAWERRRTDAWTGIWRERTARLLGWATLLGLADRREDGFARPRARPDTRSGGGSNGTG